MIDSSIQELIVLFAEHEDRYKVMELSQPILQKMAASESFLFDVIRKNISDPFFLSRERHYSTMAMNIYESPVFSFVMNIFPPLPDRNTNISFQSIHHHGALLLNTVSVFGPGYESIIFRKNYQIDKSSGITNMIKEEMYHNQLSEVKFVDAYQPHIVFYPADFSATYALWCDKRKNAKESFKKSGLLKRFKKPIASMINMFGLAKLLGLNKVEYFDFYVDKNQVFALKNRETYEQTGSNANFLQNIFAFIQQTGFNDKQFLELLIKNEETPLPAKKYIEQLINGITIKDDFFSGHLNIPYVNLEMDSVILATTENSL